MRVVGVTMLAPLIRGGAGRPGQGAPIMMATTVCAASAGNFDRVVCPTSVG